MFPSIRALVSELNLSPDQARAMRAVWSARTVEGIVSASGEHGARVQQRADAMSRCRPLYELKIYALDLIGEFHGEEFLGRHRRTGAPVSYLNAGDPYVATLIFYSARTVRVGRWGDLIESNAIRTRDAY